VARAACRVTGIIAGHLEPGIMSAYSRLVVIVAVFAAMIVAGAITFADVLHRNQPSHRATNMPDRAPAEAAVLEPANER